ncbi:DUF6457 domain-containing protein [Streptomyces ovatisporus]|uniref:DUF6457 domain-containing protein n=1 Tax=Streptomyces ovatisporus TaxID=1128682 RepID=A0ABV9AAI4_9ACTN
MLAGGGARRLGGADKPAVTVGARPLLDRVLSACADATTTVVVGPRRATQRPVTWVREQPPGGGPLAALDAGLRHTTEPTVLVLSADLPFLREETVRTLLSGVDAAPEGGSAPEGDAAADGNAAAGEPGGFEGALVDDGRDQPLLAAYRTESLRRELALLHTEYGSLHGLPLRLLLPELRLRRVRASSDTSDALDCDTWDDVAAARARIRERDAVLDEWMTAAKAELGVELDVDTAMLLDLARDAAHGVARPAAPLTTFLVGYAAAAQGGSPQDVAEASRKAVQLAARWAAEAEEAGQAGEADGER